MGKFKLKIRLPENDFPLPIRFVSADVVILAEDENDATLFGVRLMIEWGLRGIAGFTVARVEADGDFYVCPQHAHTGGYESCCNCGGWPAGDPDYGRSCTEAGT